MFRNQCSACSQKQLTSRRYTASLNDDTSEGMNTAALEAQAPGKPTQLPGIHTFFKPGNPICIDDCDSPLNVELNCGNNIKPAMNGSNTEESLVKLSASQDNLFTSQHEVNVCITCRTPLSQQVAAHTCNRTLSSDSDKELFVQKGILLIHKGETYFTCTTCARIFSKKAQLTTHMRIHTGKKPYACETCSKSFSQQSTLNTHMRVHTCEKPYVCTICGKRYGHGSTLIRHKKSQH